MLLEFCFAVVFNHIQRKTIASHYFLFEVCFPRVDQRYPSRHCGSRLGDMAGDTSVGDCAGVWVGNRRVVGCIDAFSSCIINDSVERLPFGVLPSNNSGVCALRPVGEVGEGDESEAGSCGRLRNGSMGANGGSLTWGKDLIWNIDKDSGFKSARVQLLS